MNEIYSLESLADLEDFLSSRPEPSTRKQLMESFRKFAYYENAQQWNQAVRLCEALAIVGWGECEALEAKRNKAFNGNPATGFYNRDMAERFVHADWSKRKSGLTLQAGDTYDYGSPDLPGCDEGGDLRNVNVTECVQDIGLETQRNWISKNPIRLSRAISNCYPTSEALIDEITNALIPRLDKEMVPNSYGSAINQLKFNCHFSYSDRGSTTNHVILDEDIRISTRELYERLCERYSPEEIEANGYYLRKRYDLGNFKKSTGTMSVDICFTREFSMQSTADQKNDFVEHLESAVERVVAKLSKKKLAYDFESMKSDLHRILDSWKDRS